MHKSAFAPSCKNRWCMAHSRLQLSISWHFLPRKLVPLSSFVLDFLSPRLLFTDCLIMHLVHTKRAPQYLSDSVQTVARSSSRPGLRSSNTAVYVKPRCRTKFGERGFSHAGPTAWSSLPHHLHHISDTGLFKRRLKTELFRRAYVASC